MQWPSSEFLEIQPLKFSPFILVMTEPNKPSSISMAAVAGNALRFIELWPDATLQDLPQVQKIVRERCARDQGSVALFGQMAGFFFVFSPTEGILLDVDGNQVEGGRRKGRFHPQSTAIQDGISKRR